MGRQMTRRQAMQGLAALVPAALATSSASADAAPAHRRRIEASFGTSAAAQTGEIGPYADDVLPAGVRSRFVHNINGLRIHVLEAGFARGNRPGVLLLHGFPELAYSWLKPGITCSRQTSGATDARPVGTGTTTATSPRSGGSTSSATCSAWSMYSGIARWRSLGMILVRRSPRGVP